MPYRLVPMKALAITAFEGPEALHPIDLPDPVVAPNDVVVEVETVGVNRLDLAVLRGQGPGKGAPLPLVPGIDPAGTVSRVGEEVEGVSVGDRVVAKPNIACFECPHCVAGEPWACTRQKIIGVHRPGGLAPSVAVPARNAVPIPEGVSSAEATVAVHSFPVVLRMFKQAGGVGPGSRVLVIGAAGAIGAAAVQLARFYGAEVTGVVSGGDKAAFVEGLGAAAIDRTASDLRRGLTDAAGDAFDLIADTAGEPESTMAALERLAWRGRYVTCGSHAGGRIEVDLGELYRNRQSIIGSSASGYDDVAEVFALLAGGELTAPVDHIRPVGEAREAYAELASRRNIGKIVLEHR